MPRIPEFRRSPFRPARRRPLVVHCSHHKAGTVWFRHVFGHVASAYRMQLESCVGAPVGRRTDIAFFRSARHFHKDELAGRSFRGSHLIRDPRDIIVSGYFYHLWTNEEWARRSDGQSWGGMSYQEYLNSVDRHTGLLAEIERSAGTTLADMAAWDYQQPEFLELRYEEVISDEVSMFRRLFEFYGFNEKAIAVGLAAVEKVSIHSSHRQKRHVRSGETAQWRHYFEDEHIERFKAVTGDLLVRLGYEADLDWSSGSSGDRGASTGPSEGSR